MAYDEHLAERIRSLLSDEPSLAEKRMFGGLAFLVEGSLAVAASGKGGLMARVDPTEWERLCTDPGVEPMVMRGRQMRGWVRVAPDVIEGDALAEWVARGVSAARAA